ncbi:MAG: class IV adenylate cyclase [Gemmatimonadaceae bacterium]|nr:class IV adenylate cyclase [Gemmatimonadaceae bacterium]
MREVELKSVVDDIAARRARVEQAGGTLVYEGTLIDLRYGDAAGEMLMLDHVLRLRIYERDGAREGQLDWKGPTQYETGYKVREEISTSAGDPDALAKILENLGFIVIREIERRIWQYSLGGAVVRFEEYPRMDPLVEVEGPPESIEQAIASLGLERSGFTPERLPAFMARYEARTANRAALSARELAGEYRYSGSA